MPEQQNQERSAEIARKILTFLSLEDLGEVPHTLKLVFSPGVLLALHWSPSLRPFLPSCWRLLAEAGQGGAGQAGRGARGLLPRARSAQQGPSHEPSALTWKSSTAQHSTPCLSLYVWTVLFVVESVRFIFLCLSHSISLCLID